MKIKTTTAQQNKEILDILNNEKKCWSCKKYWTKEEMMNEQCPLCYLQFSHKRIKGQGKDEYWTPNIKQLRKYNQKVKNSGEVIRKLRYERDERRFKENEM